MNFPVIKGSAQLFTGTVYSDDVNNIIQDLTGATVKAYVKVSISDSDANALQTITCTVSNPTSGVWTFVLTSATTNALTQSAIYFDVVAKLSDGVTYIKSGPQTISLIASGNQSLF